MSVVVVTGSAGLVGAEVARHFGGEGFDVVGIDNDMRARFFGPEASTVANRRELEKTLGSSYRHHDLDVRDRDGVAALLSGYGSAIAYVVHAAGQPSHDWAAREPATDFDINATGTLNLLEATVRAAPEAAFAFLSTNKVYGDSPNRLPLVELATRYELAEGHASTAGIAEDMTVDQSRHSIFGASKLAADVLVQEYGRCFGLATACFRAGTLTGPRHQAVVLHGFLAYLVQCAMTGRHYDVIGYHGKQVRDVLHAADVTRAIAAFCAAPGIGEVYNLGGGRDANVSVLEAIAIVEKISGRTLSWSHVEQARAGDHIWWISDTTRFRSHYPGWRVERDIPAIVAELCERW
ncbi:MAG: NAD-dependent epimerase/dehydratase [Acidimicrobiales bacterium]|jgi:CDP-paratose 2-epimerase|nr:NAD-dependent epimerase/dehydratase [Acidimicrobiales bacterium]